MQNVLIVIHLMIVIALVGIVLIQRSEGGGLGIGGGSGFMSARGTANALTRIYGILNGTCNYILSEMERTGADFDAMLAGKLDAARGPDVGEAQA